MTSDLDAIDHLSQQFEDSTDDLTRHTSGDRAVILSASSPVLAQGEKVLRMYEAERAKAPDDLDVLKSMARHLYRLGYLHYDAIMARYIPSNQPLKSDDSLGKDALRHADKSCFYMSNSFALSPNAGAAFILADIFRISGFYATAVHWYGQVENATDNPDLVTKAKAKRLDMQADGKTSDPILSPKSAFPTRNTPGLILENQPAAPTPAAQSSNLQAVSSSSGCGGKAALFFIIVYALAHFIR